MWVYATDGLKAGAYISLVLIAAWVPVSALADRVGVIAIDVTPSPFSAQELQEAALAGLAGDEAVTDPAGTAKKNLAAGAVRRSRLKVFQRADELLREGIRAYEAADASFAVARFGEARTQALVVADLPGGLELVAEISLRLGAAKHDLGRSDAAVDFSLTRALNPERIVTRAEFKPSVVQAFESAVAANAGSATLRVSAPNTAMVAIDGRAPERGSIEQTISSGLHVMVVRDPSGAGDASLIDVQPPMTSVVAKQPVDSGLAAASTPVRIGMPSEQARMVLGAIMVFAELDAVVTVAGVWRGGNPAILVEYCREIPVQCGSVAEIVVGSAAELKSAMRAAISGARSARDQLSPGLWNDNRVVSPENAPGRGPAVVKNRRNAWWKNPWLWVGVSSVALGVTAAVVFTSDDPARRPEFSVGSDLFEIGF